MSIAKIRSNLDPDKLLSGAVAGFIATAPMTASMALGWQFLPAQEKYPLPPRQIVGELTERAGIEDDLSEGKLVAATLLSHFGYGALFGSLYGMLAQRISLPPSIKGMLAGLALWVGSYLGWLPAMGILQPATRQPIRRNLLMIVAHIIWGVTMGVIAHKLGERRIMSF